MRVLVTGGAGFIGGRIVDRLVDDRAEVVVLDDLSTGSRERVPTGARLVVASVADPAVADVVAGLRPDVVIHAAAQVSVARSVAEPAHDAAVNVQGTRHVLAGAARAGARRAVFLSSGGAIYGETDGATEDGPVAPQSPYGEHKRLAELAVEAWGGGYGIARLSNVYGPGQRSDLEGGVVAIFHDALAAGEPVAIHGSGDQVRDFLYVDDAADAILTIAAAERDGTWNVSTGTPTSIRALLALLEERLGPAVAVHAEPARPGDVGHSVLSPERIARQLGWTARHPLAAGLDALVARNVTVPS